nr:integrase, catalytic region, zinc finger, CCHC-type, peptidase aspartic, catalytic [Tanacetum cinerariifolium]
MISSMAFTYILNGVHGSSAVPEHTTIETPTNMSPENKAHFLAEKEAIHLILTRIGNDIYSTVEAYQTAQEMWEAIERLQQVESLNIQDNLALIAKYFKKIYKPTNNNLRTSSNSKNKKVDMTPRYKNDDHSRQFGTQRTVNVAGTREKVGSPVVQKSEFSALTARNMDILPRSEKSRKGSRTPCTTRRRCCCVSKLSKVFHFKQNSMIGTNSEPVKQVQNEAGYNVFANHLQHSKQSESVSNTCLVETDDTNVIPDSPDIKSLEEFVSVRDSCLVALQNKETEFEKYNAFNDRTIDYDKLKQIDELESDKAEFSNMYDVILQECVSKDVMCSYFLSLSDLDTLDELQCLYLHKVKECDCLAQKLSKQTESVSKEVYNELLKRFAKVEKHSISLEIALQKRKEQQGKLYVTQMCLKQECIESTTGVNHKPTISRPHHKSNQLKDKVLPNNSQVKAKKTQVEVHLKIPSVSNKMKSVTAYKDSLDSRTLNANAVCAICSKCLVDSNHFACVTKMLNDMNARTKKPNVVPISTRKPKSQANISVATSHKKKIVQLILFIVDSGCTKQMTGNLKLLCNFVEKVYYIEGLNHNLFLVGQFCDADLEVAFRKSTCFVRNLQGNDLLTGNRGSDLYTISLQETTSSTSLCLMAKSSPTQAWLWYRRLSHLNFDHINLLSKKDIVIGIEHQTSTALTPEQNGVVERRNHTLVEAARTMLSA